MNLDEPKVLLVKPYTKRYPWELKRAGQPLSLLVIGTYLTKVLGIETEILDATAINYDKEYILPSGKIIYGLSPEKFKAKIAEKCPDILLFSCQFTCQYTSMVECAFITKDVCKDIIVGAGGIHVTICPEEVLMNDSIDFIFLGEETCLDNFFLALKGKKDFSELPAFGYKANGDLKINRSKCYVKNLSQIPIYDPSFLDDSLYTSSMFHNGVSNHKFIDITTERNCPYNCNFCSTGSIDTPYRKYSLTQLDDLFSNLKYSGYKQILNEDDNGFLLRDRALKVIDLYDRYGFAWQQVSGFGPNQLDNNLIDRLASSNCEKIYLAVESKKVEFRIKILNKPKSLSFYNNDDLFKTMEYLVKTGIKFDVGLIIGHPSQTLEDINDEIEFGKEIKNVGANFVIPSILTAFPGTPFWTILKNNIVGTYDDCNVMTGNLTCDNFSPKILRDIQQKAIENINDVSFEDNYLSKGWDSNSVSDKK